MPKILLSDRNVNTPEANQDPLKLVFHDFDSLPMLKGLYHGKNAEGHHFICGGVPILVSAEKGSMSRVNEALEDEALKGALISIQYLGYNEAQERGNFEVVRHDI